LINKKYYGEEYGSKVQGRVGKHSSPAKTVTSREWTAIQLVKAFRNHCLQIFHSSAAGWLKMNALSKVQTPKYLFTPCINERSRNIDSEWKHKHIHNSLNALKESNGNLHLYHLEISLSDNAANGRYKNGNVEKEIQKSSNIDNRVKMIYLRRQKNLLKQDKYKYNEQRAKWKDCTFRPKINKYKNTGTFV